MTTNSEELKPCPKCNGEVYFHRAAVKHEIGNIEHCGKWCGISFTSFAYECEEDYLAAWNTRHSEDSKMLDKIVSVSGFHVGPECYDYFLVGVTDSGDVVMSTGDGNWASVGPRRAAMQEGE